MSFFEEQLTYWREMKRKYKEPMHIREIISDIIIGLLQCREEHENRIIRINQHKKEV